MVRGQGYNKLLQELREYSGTEYYSLIHRILESKLSDIVLLLIDTQDTMETARLQGAARELRKMIDDLYPKRKIIT